MEKLVVVCFFPSRGCCLARPDVTQCGYLDVNVELLSWHDSHAFSRETAQRICQQVDLNSEIKVMPQVVVKPLRGFVKSGVLNCASSHCETAQRLRQIRGSELCDQSHASCHCETAESVRETLIPLRDPSYASLTHWHSTDRSTMSKPCLKSPKLLDVFISDSD